MMTPGRRLLTAAVLVIAAVVVLGVVLTHGDGRPTDGALQAPLPHGYSTIARPGDMFTDGFEVLRLSGNQDAVIEDVRLVGARGLELLGARLAPPDRGFGSVQALASWPPRGAFKDVKMVNAMGATITPVKQDRAGWELLLGVKVTGEPDAPLIRDGIQIDYRVGDESYTTYRPAQLVVCTADDQLREDGFCPLPTD